MDARAVSAPPLFESMLLLLGILVGLASGKPTGKH